MSYILFRYLHLIAIVVLAGALLIQNMAISRNISGEDARNLAKVNTVVIVSALLVLLFGLALWFWVGKPEEFYTANILFKVKLGLYVLLALLSVAPTHFLLGHRQSDAENLSVPAPLIWVLRTEIAVLLVLPVLAVLMARGVGLPS